MTTIYRVSPESGAAPVSRGFSYSWDANAPVGQRVVPGSVKLADQPIAATSRVRITVNGFLASGGDSFTALKQGQESRTGMMDIDAFELFVKNNPSLMPGRSLWTFFCNPANRPLRNAGSRCPRTSASWAWSPGTEAARAEP